MNFLGDKQFSRPQMEALQFDPRKKVLSLVKTDLPAIIEKNEVIVKVTYAGVCGTDLHILDGTLPCRDRPFIPGHEFCGVASSIGSEVKHIKRGDRVVVDPNTGCNSCTYCTSGNYHQCPIEGMHTAIGIFHNGGWAQFCKVPAKQVHRIPDTMTFQQAALCEPLSCVCHGWDRVAPLPIGSTVLISGAGIIGNLWTSVLHHSGHRKVIIAEPTLARRQLSLKLETGYQCLSPDEVQMIKAKNPEWGVDVCVDCSGNGMAIQDAVTLLRPGGKMCIFGVAAPDTRISVSPYEIYKKELTIVGVLLNQFSFPKALGMIEAMGTRYMDYERLGVEVFKLDQYQEAIQALRKGTIAKVVFKIAPGPD